MRVNKRTFDVLFIIISAIILIGLHVFGILESLMAFSLIPILIAYQIGQFSEKKFSKK